MDSPVRHSTEDGVAVVRLNRPEARNAMNQALRQALTELLGELGADPGVRAVVLTGEGPAFCAGGDITSMRARLDSPPGEVAATGWRHQGANHRMVTLLHTLPKPTVAAVNGHAVGLGVDLALACDFVVAARRATFATNFVLRGLVPDAGGLYFLPRRVGLAAAKHMIYSGRRVGADEALGIGLADRIADDDQLLIDALALAREVSAGSALALGFAKAMLDRSSESHFEQLFEMSRQAQAACYTTAEHRAGVEAFLNR